jgi:predicted regulator of Ras-like GTPase activity (Roadblock/LC7/MglB family)
MSSEASAVSPKRRRTVTSSELTTRTGLSVVEQRSAAFSEMDADIAADWELWSEQIGRALLPVVEELADSLPSFDSAMVCTLDGFNLCAVGVEEMNINQLSTMTSSLHSIADSLCDIGATGSDERLAVVSLAHGKNQTVVFAIRDLIIGPVLLWVSARETLGVMLIRAKVAAEGVRNVLASN